MFLALLGSLLIGPQDDPALQVQTLIAQLRSDSIEEREDAQVKLGALGEIAIPELEKTLKSNDTDLAKEARILIRIIKLSLSFTPALKRAAPGIAETLASAPLQDWTRMFLKVTEEERGAPPTGPVLKRKDVEPLAIKALLGSKLVHREMQVCQMIVRYNCRSAIPQLLAKLRDPNGTFRYHALKTLSQMRVKEAIPDVVRLLDDPVLRFPALAAVELLGAREAAPRLFQFLDPGHDTLRSASLRILGSLSVYIPPEKLVLLAGDKDYSLASAAAKIILKESDPGVAGARGTRNNSTCRQVP